MGSTGVREPTPGLVDARPALGAAPQGSEAVATVRGARVPEQVPVELARALPRGGRKSGHREGIVPGIHRRGRAAGVGSTGMRETTPGLVDALPRSGLRPRGLRG